MKPIIRVSNIGKQYRIGRREGPYATMRESLANAAAAPLRGVRQLWRRSHNGHVAGGSSYAACATLDSQFNGDRFWALRDINFDVRPGEVVGVIGRNGAGKSTLLKILSRITEPTTGRVELYGRVGSLLEVGTGFHPELTGRENIYLSGAVLGMTKREIRRKFDAIVDFSGVGQFIDTPVKRCSSGMYLRLAFAVAAHLDPEILLVDEVLAVGDASFQKKCLGKMEEVAGQGRTVFFVSHNMPSIKSLCSRAIWIHEGKAICDGGATEVVTDYLKQSSDRMSAECVWHVPEERPGNAHFRLLALRVLNPQGEVTGTYSSSEPLTVEMQFDLDANYTGLVVGFDLVNRDGIVVFRTSHNDRSDHQWPEVRPGRNCLQCVIPPGLLNAGNYGIAPKVGLHAVTWFLNGETEICFDIVVDHSESPFWNVDSQLKLNGVIAPCLPWREANGNGHASSFDAEAARGKR